MDRLDFDCEFKLLDPTSDAAGTIEGYASVFNVMDDGGDIVIPGAFKATLADWKKRKSLPAMLWQHDTAQPIGLWTEMAEDDKGLKVKGNLILGVPQADTARTLILGGAVKGLSMGFRTRDYEIDRNTGARQLKKVDLYEISPVTIPMLREAQVTSVKGLGASDREIEQALRDGGLSIKDAKIGVSIVKKMALRDGGQHEHTPRDAGATDVLLAMRRAAEALRS